jgi:hypothetical protein
MNPNQAARLLIMSAYLYYRCDVSVMSDGDYDKLSLTIAKNWDKLDEQLQWQLGDREAIKSTGMGILITQMGMGAAHHWYHKKKNVKLKDGLVRPYLQDAAGFSLINNGDFQGPHPKFKCLYAVV